MTSLMQSGGFETGTPWQVALLSCLVSFVLAYLIAAVYGRTYQGLSWSRGLVQGMVLGSVVACLLMMAIGDNLARGIGIVGSLSIIRFRTNLRDPKDLIFILAALGVGIAAGVQAYMVGVVGAVVFCGVSFFLRYVPFGERRTHDGLLRFQLPADGDQSVEVAHALKAVSQHFTLVNMRKVAQGSIVDYAYQIKFKRAKEPEALLQALGEIEGLKGLAFMNQQSTVEV